MLIACALRAHANVAPAEVALSSDRSSLSVSFYLTTTNKRCSYNLVSTNTFALDAKITVQTERGETSRTPTSSRTFTSRKPGIWATAVLEDNTATSHLQVSGLFQCDNVLWDIPALKHGMPLNHNMMQQQQLTPSGFHNRLPMNSPHLRSGRLLAGQKDCSRKFCIAIEDNETWRVPPEGNMVNIASSNQEWSGTKWYPGCYSGDQDLHVFKIGLITDVEAINKHGSIQAVEALVESTIAKASMVYENQLNIKLEVSELRSYTDPNTAPTYASQCLALDTQLDSLQQSTDLPAGGAVHLLTGCGTGVGWVGLAFLDAICAGGGWNTGVNQLHNSNSWITFAHELGHNFGGEHSFEEGQGQTGGIMDYGDGTLNGDHQFNTQYRKDQMCAVMGSSVNNCNGNFKLAPQSPTPRPSSDGGASQTPTPTSDEITASPTPAQTPQPTPPPPSCQNIAENCEELAQMGLCSGCSGCTRCSSCSGDYEFYMTRNCANSCDKCGESCLDEYQSCPTWGSYGFCAAGSPYQSFMHQYCPKTCGTCDTRGLNTEDLVAPNATTLPELRSFELSNETNDTDDPDDMLSVSVSNPISLCPLVVALLVAPQLL